MEEKKKMGRPSQGKGWMSFSLDQEIVDFLKSLQPGDRSKIVNNLLARGIAEYKAIQEVKGQSEMIVHEINVLKANMSIMQDLASKGFEPTHEAKSNIGAMYTFINDQETIPVDKRVDAYQIRKNGRLAYSCYPSRGEEDYSYVREEDGKTVYSSRKTDKFE